MILRTSRGAQDLTKEAFLWTGAKLLGKAGLWGTGKALKFGWKHPWGSIGGLWGGSELLSRINPARVGQNLSIAARRI